MVLAVIALAERVHHAGCTTGISKFGGCFTVTPSGQVMVLHRRQRTHWLKCPIGIGNELEGASPEVEGLPVVGRDPQTTCRTQAQGGDPRDRQGHVGGLR